MKKQPKKLPKEENMTAIQKSVFKFLAIMYWIMLFVLIVLFIGDSLYLLEYMKIPLKIYCLDFGIFFALFVIFMWLFDKIAVSIINSFDNTTY